MTRHTLASRLDGGTVLVTGGAGFIGAHIAIALRAEAPGATIVSLDNLRRPGSSLNVPRLRDHGVEFVLGDVRSAQDLELGGRQIDWLIDCAAEPSIQAARRQPGYATETNLVGSVNCLERARRDRARVVFLSTSRVYPIARLNAMATREDETRFTILPNQHEAGVSEAGVSERLSLDGVRSIYGATKLASELLLIEYGASYEVPFVINRLGIVAGPGQMGTREQGVFTYWLAQHYFGGHLRFTGWGGTGKQVRDLLHVEDVWALVRAEITEWDRVEGQTFNVGGGLAVSLSLREATAICEGLVGRRLDPQPHAATDPLDVRVYVTDHRAVTAAIGWRPRHDATVIFNDTLAWIRRDESILAGVLGAR
ncbi:MAG: NAD-dependent epimerase/dehydratase family protein [Acidobacteriota bacterium]